MIIGPKVKQFLHGLFVTVGSTVTAVVVPVLNTGTVPTLHQMETAGIIGIGAGVTYLVKNYLLGSATTCAPTEEQK
jgi:hypothetical protein